MLGQSSRLNPEGTTLEWMAVGGSGLRAHAVVLGGSRVLTTRHLGGVEDPDQKGCGRSHDLGESHDRVGVADPAAVGCTMDSNLVGVARVALCSARRGWDAEAFVSTVTGVPAVPNERGRPVVGATAVTNGCQGERHGHSGLGHCVVLSVRPLRRTRSRASLSVRDLVAVVADRVAVLVNDVNRDRCREAQFAVTVCRA